MPSVHAQFSLFKQCTAGPAHPKLRLADTAECLCRLLLGYFHNVARHNEARQDGKAFQISGWAFHCSLSAGTNTGATLWKRRKKGFAIQLVESAQRKSGCIYLNIENRSCASAKSSLKYVCTHHRASFRCRWLQAGLRSWCSSRDVFCRYQHIAHQFSCIEWISSSRATGADSVGLAVPDAPGHNSSANACMSNVLFVISTSCVHTTRLICRCRYSWTLVKIRVLVAVFGIFSCLFSRCYCLLDPKYAQLQDGQSKANQFECFQTQKRLFWKIFRNPPIWYLQF